MGKKYDIEIKQWPYKKNELLSFLPDRKAKRFMEAKLDLVFQNKVDTWDLQWLYSCWANNGISLFPARNLIQNIGFGKNATHTKIETGFSNLQKYELRFPLRHPKKIVIDNGHDHQYLNRLYPESLIMNLFKFWVRKIIH